MTTWHQTPQDAGQMVDIHWAAAGEHGAICRVVDRSDPRDEPSYAIHRWRRDGVYAPWNGDIGVQSRHRRITAAEAMALLEAAEQ